MKGTEWHAGRELSLTFLGKSASRGNAALDLALSPGNLDPMGCPVPFDPACAELVYRRNMPHWRQRGAAYFVTFRLADSVPNSVVRKWLEQSRRWLDAQPLPHGSDVKWEYAARVGRNLLRYLDADRGRCYLRRPDARRHVQSAMEHFEGTRYLLGEYAIMPNHVHALVMPLGKHDLWQITASWKAFSAVRVNRCYARTGKLFQGEAFDHIVRSRAAYRRFADYIRNNPKHLPEEHATVGIGKLRWE